MNEVSPQLAPSVIAANEAVNATTPLIPVAKPAQGTRLYISVQDDWWDLISLRVYGMKRGDDHLMHKLIEANYHLRNVSRFEGGMTVFVPPVPIKTEIPLVPWKKTSLV
jgi:hypothetical protein